GEDAGPRRIHPWSNNFTGIDQVRISKNVVSAALWIAGSSNSVGEIREILPYLCLIDSARRPHVRMHVDEARHYRLAGDINDFGARGNLDRAFGPKSGYAVIGDDDIAFLYDLVAFHRYQAGARQ